MVLLYANSINPSTTIKIESLLLSFLGSPKTKSIDMSTHDSFGIGKGVYNSYGKSLNVAFLHVMQLPQMRLTSLFILDQHKRLCKMSKVFMTPEWLLQLYANSMKGKWLSHKCSCNTLKVFLTTKLPNETPCLSHKQLTHKTSRHTKSIHSKQVPI